MDCIVHGILKARILEWVAFPFSRGSSQPRDQTQVSCIAGRFFTSWATGKPKRKHRGSKHRQQPPSSGWKQREKGRPLGFGSLERVLGEAGTQYAAQLVLVPHTGHKEAGSGWEKGWKLVPTAPGTSSCYWGNSDKNREHPPGFLSLCLPSSLIPIAELNGWKRIHVPVSQLQYHRTEYRWGGLELEDQSFKTDPGGERKNCQESKYLARYT